MFAEEKLRNCLARLNNRDFSAVLISEFKDMETKVGVEIEYRKGFEMKLKGLQPDNPPYVWLKEDKILVSNDDKEYHEVDLGVGLQAFRLLDPRLLLDPEISRIISGLGDTIIVEYDITKIDKRLKFPKPFMDRMERFGELRRPVECTIQGEILQRMRQKNLPPSEEYIKMTFYYRTLY
jgi:hypothetical protein